jgi:hypothetical protein
MKTTMNLRKGKRFDEVDDAVDISINAIRPADLKKWGRWTNGRSIDP